jgi:hypothetical protein
MCIDFFGMNVLKRGSQKNTIAVCKLRFLFEWDFLNERSSSEENQLLAQIGILVLVGREM